MEDSTEFILQDQGSRIVHSSKDNPILTVATGALLAGLYGMWTMFALPGFRKVPRRLKVHLMCSGRALKSINSNTLKNALLLVLECSVCVSWSFQIEKGVYVVSQIFLMFFFQMFFPITP